ncbi:uncharacterized protein FOKN1_2046 [Thiohalobacter thiocyanaticus]|uniref:Uncharacterized protein n=1 Tax=Thiohalobacter thiocyanaticus TaxID=585455 RepID=A0A1Z4VS16_9GAMM|nr:hypothetical protein [Thiohalobacter thiocyanaticus]BAZ94426.1 uncharacterized protein FOKN1_2046 [Thiohalobacter thiocyanaticus]
MERILSLNHFRYLMVFIFTGIFLILTLVLTGITVASIWHGFAGDTDLVESFIKAINTAVVALATFELGLVVHKEYRSDETHVIVVLRRTLPRFISIVCIALALEGLLMVIKYSQLEMAGNLFYPVAIIVSAALLLAALGVFLRLSDGVDDNHFDTGMPQHAAAEGSPAGMLHPATDPQTPSGIL